MLTLLNLYNNSCTAVVGPYTYFKSSITDQLAKLKQNIMQKGPWVNKLVLGSNVVSTYSDAVSRRPGNLNIQDATCISIIEPTKF